MRLSSNATTPQELREEIVTLLMLRAKQQIGLAGLTQRKSLKETHEYAAEVLGKLAGEVKCMELSPSALQETDGLRITEVPTPQERFKELAKDLQIAFAIRDLEDEDLTSDGSPCVLDAATKGPQELTTNHDGHDV